MRRSKTPYRLERENNKKQLHPLVEWGWDEKTCLQYCYQKGYDWEGLYQLFHRVSCWCCPLQSLSELRKLRIHFPDLWAELKDMDERTWRTFRADYSVKELEIRFDFEEERISQGLSITNKDFRQKLKEKIRKEGERKMTNTLKLRAAILESGLNQEQIAKLLGMTVATFNYKVNNKSEFRASEIKKLCEILKITDIDAYFFADEVE